MAVGLSQIRAESQGGTVPAAVAFDPLNPENLRNPYPRYAQLREAGPVLWDEPLESWLLTRHRDCVAVLRDTQHFAADPRRLGYPVPDAALTVQMLDPPDHGAVRGPLNGACRAQDLAAVRRRAHRHADELLARVAEQGGGEFMTGFAAPFSLAAICDFLGVEPPDLATLAPIGDAIFQGMDAGLRPEQARPAAEAQARLKTIFGAWFHPPPQAGMFGTLVAQSADRVLSATFMGSLYAVFNAGYLSVFSTIGNAAIALLRYGRDLTQSLDPGTLDLAVEELLRYAGSGQAVSRVCVEDVELGAARIRRGQTVVLLLAAANRDPDEFTRPDDLVLDRTPNRHLGFGWGIHTCLAASLARDLMKITLLSLRDNIPQIRLAGEPVYKSQATVRCPDRIPVSLAM
jgi:cytochrome P450